MINNILKNKRIMIPLASFALLVIVMVVIAIFTNPNGMLAERESYELYEEVDEASGVTIVHVNNDTEGEVVNNPMFLGFDKLYAIVSEEKVEVIKTSIVSYLTKNEGVEKVERVSLVKDSEKYINTEKLATAQLIGDITYNGLGQVYQFEFLPSNNSIKILKDGVLVFEHTEIIQEQPLD